MRILKMTSADALARFIQMLDDLAYARIVQPQLVGDLSQAIAVFHMRGMNEPIACPPVLCHRSWEQAA